MEEERIIDYCKSVLILEDLEDVKNSLPYLGSNDFMKVMNLLIHRQADEISELIEAIKLTDDIEELEEYQRYVVLGNQKLNIFEQHKLEYLELHQMVENEDLEEPLFEAEGQKTNLIYATNSTGEAFLKRDLNLSKISERTRKDFLEILERLQLSGGSQTKYNTTKRRKLANNHTINCMEEKEFQARVYFQYLDKDTIFVIMGLEKKADNNQKEIKAISLRLNYVQKQFEITKGLLKNPEEKKRIIEEHGTISDDLKSYLMGREL